MFALFLGVYRLAEQGKVALPADYAAPDEALTDDAVGAGQFVGGFAKTIASVLVSQVAIKGWWKLGINKQTRNAIKQYGAESLDDLKKIENDVIKKQVTTIEQYGWGNRTLTDHKFTKAKLNELGSNKDWKSFLKSQTFLGKAKVVELATLNDQGKPNTFTKYKWSKTGVAKAAAGAVLAQAVLVAVHALVAKGDATLITVATVVTNTVDFVQQSITVVSTIAQIKGVKATLALKDAAQGTYKAAVKLLADKVTKLAAITTAIGVVVEIGILVGFFVGQMANQGGYDPGLRGNRVALAGLIAAIIVAVILAIIATIPGIGILIVAIIGAIDALAGLICGVANVNESKKTARVLCGGITGVLTAIVQFIIYDNDPVIQIDHEFTVEANAPPEIVPVDAKAGFTVGNQINVSLPARIQLFKDRSDGFLSLVETLWRTNKKTKQTTYSVEFVSDQSASRDGSLNKGDDQDKWIFSNNLPILRLGAIIDTRETGDPKGDFYRDVTATGRGDLLTAGANQPLSNIYLSIAYAVPTLECTVAACWEITTRDTHNVDLGIKFDILPKTFAEFVQLKSQPLDGVDGYTFNWAAGLEFPTFRDADGDGLISKSKGGNDPDDSTWDTDGDGLSDYFEVRNGLNASAVNIDTDFDGLWDIDELQQGTDPTLADTDSDGLTDNEEVYHRDRSSGDWVGGWTIVYDFDGSTPLEAQVFPNPVEPNEDDDAYSDRLEQVYGFHPQLVNTAEILGVDTQIDEIVYESTAGQTCANLRLDTLTISDAVRDDAEPLEFGDAEIAIFLTDSRVWFQEGLSDSSSVSLGINYPFCDRQVELSIVEIDQGDWNNDLIATMTISTTTSSFNQTFVNTDSSQGSEVVLAATLSAYTAATVPVAEPTDGFVAPGQQLQTTSIVENQLNNRNALGLLNAEFPAAEPGSSTLYDQPFILPPNQQTTIAGRVQVEDGISASQVVSFTTTAGALVNPTFDFSPVRDVYTPTVHITFDDVDTSGGVYNNVAPGGTAVVGNVANRNPSRDANGAFRQAATFTRIGYDSLNRFMPQKGKALQVTDSNNTLALNGGSFTLSSWIKRTEDISTAGAIAGYMPGLDRAKAYPTLYVDGPEIGLYFGNGTSACEVITNSDPLVLNRWQHVAATFDATSGQVTIYLDGTRIHTGNCSERPNQQSQFWIGR
ncbi:MAG: hypothetical protein PVH65_16830, partial [Chloroflexota bacterium]